MLADVNRLFSLERAEKTRQKQYLSLIASENEAFSEVLKISSSVFTNKYAEGYIKNRYYSGCKYVDEVENIAIEAAKKVFNCSFANVQPFSGTIANFAIYKAFLNYGDTILSMNISCGGHITHGLSSSLTGQIYKIIFYSLDENECINYSEIQQLAEKHKPKLIIAGSSSYSLKIDFQKFKQIADSINAYLFADISHLSGLIITKNHPSCFPYCDVAMTTTHKQLRGPRGAIILWNSDRYSQKINSAVFPGLQGGPSVALIAAKAVSLIKINDISFKNYFDQVLKNSIAMCNRFIQLGCKVISKKTETHLFLLDVQNTFKLDGNTAEKILEEANICVNKNLIPGDINPKTPQGIRIGTLWGTVKNLKEDEFIKVADFIYLILKNYDQKNQLKQNIRIVKKEILKLLKI